MSGTLHNKADSLLRRARRLSLADATPTAAEREQARELITAYVRSFIDSVSDGRPEPEPPKDYEAVVDRCGMDLTGLSFGELLWLDGYLEGGVDVAERRRAEAKSYRTKRSI